MITVSIDLFSLHKRRLWKLIQAGYFISWNIKCEVKCKIFFIEILTLKKI
jgi:hypothetical protein